MKSTKFDIGDVVVFHTITRRDTQKGTVIEVNPAEFVPYYQPENCYRLALLSEWGEGIYEESILKKSRQR